VNFHVCVCVGPYVGYEIWNKLVKRPVWIDKRKNLNYYLSHNGFLFIIDMEVHLFLP